MKEALIALVLLVAATAAKEYCTPDKSCWPSPAEIAVFKFQFSSIGARVMTPDDSDWPGRYMTYNQAVAKTPAMIVFVGDVDTIRSALKFAYKYNIKISIVSSGHSFYGRCGAENSMQISVLGLNGIEVDLNCKEHRMGCMEVQSGVKWAEAYREAEKHNRLVIGGSAPTVSVSGWTLGGGHSPLSRMFGLGVHNVLQFHLVTADLNEVWTSGEGTMIKTPEGKVTTSNDTSLFWALRGGGSAFGVLVDMKIKMHPDAKIVQSGCMYDAFTDGSPRTYEIMYKSLGEFLLKAPRTFSGYIIPFIACNHTSKECLATSSVSILHYGERANSPDAEWFRKLEDMPHDWAVQGLVGGCRQNKFDSFYKYEMTVPNDTYTTVYIGGSLIQADKMNNDLVESMVNSLDEAYKKGRSLMATATWVGGAVTDVPVGVTPMHKGWSNAIMSITAGTGWQDGEDNSELKDGVKNFHKNLDQFSDGKYYNEAENDMSPNQWKSVFWGMETYEKLMKIKKQWDPKNVFTCTQCLGDDWNPEEETPDPIG